MATIAARPARLVYAWNAEHNEWTCSYLGLTGTGSTPEAARAHLVEILTGMSQSWHSAPIQ